MYTIYEDIKLISLSKLIFSVNYLITRQASFEVMSLIKGFKPNTVKTSKLISNHTIISKIHQMYFILSIITKCNILSY